MRSGATPTTSTTLAAPSPHPASAKTPQAPRPPPARADQLIRLHERSRVPGDSLVFPLSPPDGPKAACSGAACISGLTNIDANRPPCRGQRPSTPPQPASSILPRRISAGPIRTTPDVRFATIAKYRGVLADSVTPRSQREPTPNTPGIADRARRTPGTSDVVPSGGRQTARLLGRRGELPRTPASVQGGGAPPTPSSHGGGGAGEGGENNTKPQRQKTGVWNPPRPRSFPDPSRLLREGNPPPAPADGQRGRARAARSTGVPPHQVGQPLRCAACRHARRNRPPTRRWPAADAAALALHLTEC